MLKKKCTDPSTVRLQLFFKEKFIITEDFIMNQKFTNVQMSLSFHHFIQDLNITSPF